MIFSYEGKLIPAVQWLLQSVPLLNDNCYSIMRNSASIAVTKWDRLNLSLMLWSSSSFWSIKVVLFFVYLTCMLKKHIKIHKKPYFIQNQNLIVSYSSPLAWSEESTQWCELPPFDLLLPFVLIDYHNLRTVVIMYNWQNFLKYFYISSLSSFVLYYPVHIFSNLTSQSR